VSGKVIVIGGGITGSAVAYDLSLRGMKVVLLERGSIGSGTSGRTHGLLHSGCRYIKDPQVAAECYRENMILRKIAPFLFETNGGLFVAITDEDMVYRERFLNGCEKSGIPVKEIRREEALKLEPNLNENLKAAIVVPDGTFDPLKVILSFLASAKARGAEIRPFNEVVGFVKEGDSVVGVKVWDKISEREYILKADIIVNATGAWGGKVGKLAGITVPVKPAPGVMVSLDERLVDMVINRLNPPSDGDIILSHRSTSVIGTTSWYIDDPDKVEVPKEHVERLIKRGAEMVPAVKKTRMRSVYVSSRPLIAGLREGSREVSRGFAVIDHEKEGVYGIISVIGGKFTTARLMAEKVVDLVCEKLGVEAQCRTQHEPLLKYYHYFRM